MDGVLFEAEGGGKMAGRHCGVNLISSVEARATVTWNIITPVLNNCEVGCWVNCAFQMKHLRIQHFSCFVWTHTWQCSGDPLVALGLLHVLPQGQH